jgi:hypothetical protein
MSSYYLGMDTTAHAAAIASVGGTFMWMDHMLPEYALVISSVAGTLSVVTMIASAFSKWSDRHAKIKAAELQAQAQIEAAKVVAAASLVKQASEIASAPHDDA